MSHCHNPGTDVNPHPCGLDILPMISFFMVFRVNSQLKNSVIKYY